MRIQQIDTIYIYMYIHIYIHIYYIHITDRFPLGAFKACRACRFCVQVHTARAVTIRACKSFRDAAERERDNKYTHDVSETNAYMVVS